MNAPAGKRILIVEDDAATADLIRLALRKEGWTAEVVRDGKAALARIGKAPVPWLVTLDIGLPDMSGVELILAVKAATGWANVPIVMVTATPKDENVNWAIRQGAAGYIVKPIKLEDLQDAVRRLAKSPA